MNYVIVGLGNPGDEYTNTRHNTGFLALDAIFKKLADENAGDSVDWQFDKKINAYTAKIQLKNAKGKVGKHECVLIKPQTFMNKSGGSLSKLITSAKKAEQLIVIHDDLDQPIGNVKAVFNRGSGGHRGIESITKTIKTEGYYRIKVGISPATAGGKIKKPLGEEAVEKNILGDFKPTEKDLLKKVFKKIIEGVEVLGEYDGQLAKDKMIQVVNTK